MICCGECDDTMRELEGANRKLTAQLAERDAEVERLTDGLRKALAPYGDGPTDLAIVTRLRALLASEGET